jgi:hypothetical protein
MEDQDFTYYAYMTVLDSAAFLFFLSEFSFQGVICCLADADSCLSPRAFI